MAKSANRKKPVASHVTYSDFRARLAAYMDQVCDNRAPLHVTRQRGRTVVVISEDEFDGWLETLHLLRSPANARRLMESIAAADAGKLVERGRMGGAPAKPIMQPRGRMMGIASAPPILRAHRAGLLYAVVQRVRPSTRRPYRSRQQ